MGDHEEQLRQELQEQSANSPEEKFPPRCDIGKAIYFLRNIRDLSTRELGRRVGVSSTVICNIESGKSETRTRTLFSICKALDINPQDFTLFTVPFESLTSGEQFRLNTILRQMYIDTWRKDSQ